MEEQIQMLDYRYQKISGFMVVAGLSYEVNDHLSLGLSLSPPYFRKVEGESSLSYLTPLEEIETKAQASDRIKRPPVLGLGSRLVISPDLEIFLDAVYFGWKQYSFPTSEKNSQEISETLSGWLQVLNTWENSGSWAGPGPHPTFRSGSRPAARHMTINQLDY